MARYPTSRSLRLKLQSAFGFCAATLLTTSSEAILPPMAACDARNNGAMSSERSLLTAVRPDRIRITAWNSSELFFRDGANEPLLPATAAATDGIAMCLFLVENDANQQDTGAWGGRHGQNIAAARCKFAAPRRTGMVGTGLLG